MILPEDFQVHVDYDEQGLIVKVTNLPTGLSRKERPEPSQSIWQIQNSLIEELLAEICPPMEEFESGTGRCGINKKIGDYYSVTHRPTGIRRSRNTIEDSIPRQVHKILMDEVVAELWRLRVSKNQNNKLNKNTP